MDDETSFWPPGEMEHQEKIKKFGTHVRKLRRGAGYSQEAFAHLIGLDRTYIGGIERGERNPSLKVIFSIALALQIEASELFRE